MVVVGVIIFFILCAKIGKIPLGVRVANLRNAKRRGGRVILPSEAFRRNAKEEARGGGDYCAGRRGGCFKEGFN
jgi:hypothetical protein